MLSFLSETAREYRAHAALARAYADATHNPSIKKTYLDIERYWLDRARNYDWAECFRKSSGTK